MRRAIMTTAVLTAFVTAVTVSFLLGACTTVTVKRITNPADTTTEGIRFYRPFPYLWVTEETARGATEDRGKKKAGNPEAAKPPRLEYKIIWLPDLSQEYVIQVRAGFGTVDFKPQLEEGWRLVGLDVKLDSKTKEFMESVTGFISVEPKLFGGAALTPGLYKFEFGPDGKVSGLKPINLAP